MEEFLGNTLVAAEELKEAAPILQPAQIERIVEDAKQEFELGEMTELLPFINQDTINKLAYRRLKTAGMMISRMRLRSWSRRLSSIP